MDKKICSICKEEKNINEFYSYKKKKANGTEYISYHTYCKECSRKKSKQWQQVDNREKYLATKSEHNKKYFSKPENKVRHKEIVRKSREKGYNINWQRNNKDKINQYNLKRKMNKQHEITKKEWEQCKKYFNNCCAYCGISEELHRQIHNQDLHKEHVDHLGANDLSNCVPSCKVCNSSKHDSELDDWYNKDNENYTDEKLEKIHIWLSNDYTKHINNLIK